MSRARAALAQALSVLAIAAFAAGATTPQAPAAGGARRANLLLVTIDTLRADRVGAYGHASAETPALDRLAREGVLVEDAVVQAPQTRPSHASLLTGRYPYEHGLRDNADGPLDPRWPTLAACLQASGYDTAGFVGAYPVSRPSGLYRGFKVFGDPFSGAAAGGRREPRSERPGGEVVDAALSWLTRRGGGSPFFLWVHLFDPHAPYDPPPPFAERFRADLYDGEVAYADAQLGRLLAELDRSSLARDTLVVATSDHGEGLGDHGEAEHMLLVYDSTLRVPLLARWPGRIRSGVRVGGQFRSIDLMPTLLELLALPPVPASGASRAAALAEGGRLPDNESYAESLYGQRHFGWAPLFALRAEGWKYIDAPAPELYSLREDPGETRNRLDERPQLASGMRAALARLGGAAAARPVRPSADSVERLAALGYLSGAGSPEGSGGIDPKQRAAAFSAYQRDSREAVRLYGAGQAARALPILRRLAATPPPSFNVSYYLGRALVDTRRFAEAVAPLEQAVAAAPQVGLAWAYLAEAFRGAGRGADAARAVERGLTAVPGNAALLLARGRLRLHEGDLAAAAADLEAARRKDPEDADVMVALSDLRRARGEAASAVAAAEAALSLDPDSVRARVALALALGAAGREAEAGGALHEALARDPEQPDALFFLAAIERRAGRPEAALPLLERLGRAAPDYPGAAAALAGARAQAKPPAPGTLRLRLLRFEARAPAQAASERLAAAADPARLGVAGAEARDLGDVRLDDLMPALRDAAAALAVGAASPPLPLGDAWVILVRLR